jgi:hypothetical protein
MDLPGLPEKQSKLGIKALAYYVLSRRPPTLVGDECASQDINENSKVQKTRKFLVKKSDKIF